MKVIKIRSHVIAPLCEYEFVNTIFSRNEQIETLRLFNAPEPEWQYGMSALSSRRE